MLFLRSWLEEYIDLSGYTNKELADIITTKSSEVEEVRVISDYFDAKVVVGQIKNVRKHTDADKLNVFDVVIGDRKSIQIVSAAPNVEEDLLVPVALEGAKMPSGIIIVPRKMRGEESQGMCCGKSELMLETETSPGLWELAAEYGKAEKAVKLGQSICEAFPDYFPVETVFDIKVLPNKIGVFGSYLGMALEIAFCLENKGLLKRKASRILDPEIFLDDVRNQFNFKPSIVDREEVKFSDNTGYTKSFSLFDVNYTDSKDYFLDCQLQKRMYLVGINMIGGLADISNYLLFDVGQPTHFFSTSKVENLTGKNINWSIKKLEKETKFEGLGQLKNTTLSKNLRVLVDEKDNILAIPGISGGKNSSLDINDKNVILEVANFEAEEVSRVSFALKYRSDGSKIWAGSVNQELLFVVLLHLRELLGDSIDISPILLWSAQTGYGESIDEFLSQSEPVRIKIDMEYLANRLDGRGLSYWQPILEQKLQLLGVYENQILTVEAFYSNLQTQQDVLEELVRSIGFEDLEPQALNITSNQEIDNFYSKVYLLKKTLLEFGFDEVITRPFTDEKKPVDKEKSLKVIKPYRSTEPYLRDNLLNSLIEKIALNINEGYKEPRIFEINSIFTQAAGIIKESKVLEVVFVSEDPYLGTSIAYDLWRTTSRKPIEEYKQLADFDSTMGRGVWLETNIEKDTWINLKEISNTRKKQFDFPLNKKLWSISVFLDNWEKIIYNYKSYQDQSEYPSVNRSYNIQVGQKTSWKTAENIITKISIDGINLDINPIERKTIDGKDMLTFSIRFVSYIKTLTSEDIAGFEVLMKIAFDEIGVIYK
jgi:phenylalanyl-tRNA synthetase beta chain